MPLRGRYSGTDISTKALTTVGTAGSLGFENKGSTELNENVRIGSSVAPTVALDVTGAAKISSTLTGGDAEFAGLGVGEVPGTRAIASTWDAANVAYSASGNNLMGYRFKHVTNEVFANAFNGMKITNTSNNSSQSAQCELGIIQPTATSHNTIFFGKIRAADANREEFIRATTDGTNAKVGINSLGTDPSFNLDVTGDGRFTDDLHIKVDSKSILFGAVDDAGIKFTGSTFIIQSDLIGSTDALQLRGGTNGIDFNIGATEQMTLTDGVFRPTTDSDVDLGTTSIRWKDLYVDSITTTGDVAVSGDVVLKNGTTTVDGAITFDRTNEDLSVGDGSASQVVHMGAWKTWTPVFAGFSADPVVTAARYTVIGKTITAWLITANGTSNATTFTVTLPVAAASTAKQHLTIAQVTDNGMFATNAGLLRTNVNSVTADVYINGDQGATAWTATGGKKVNFVVTYESN